MNQDVSSRQTLDRVAHEALATQRRRYLPIPLRLVAALALLIAAGTALLLLPGMTTQPITFVDALFAAFSTTGLSLGVTTELGTPGRLILVAVMFWGRLGAVTIMLVLLRTQARKTLVKYPEEPVLVG